MASHLDKKNNNMLSDELLLKIVKNKNLKLKIPKISDDDLNVT